MEALCLPSVVAVPAAATSLYAQVLGLGFVWTSLHCSGMCGPLVAGLGFGQTRVGARIGTAMLDVLLYQGGRALVYAGLGASAGWVGSSLAEGMQRWAPMMALVMGAVFTVIVLRRLSPSHAQPAMAVPASALAAWAAGAARGLRDHPRLRAMTLGMILAFLPCMLVFWVLSLAAVSASPAHGAALMVLLVGVTIPVLMAAAVAPLLIGRWRRASFSLVPSLPLAVSASWLLCIGLAGLGVVPHAGLRWGDFVVVLW